VKYQIFLSCDWAGTWACGCASLSRPHGRAGQGCEELETSPAVALLGQGLTAETGSWAVGRAWEPRGWAGTGRAVGAFSVPTNTGKVVEVTLPCACLRQPPVSCAREDSPCQGKFIAAVWAQNSPSSLRSFYCNDHMFHLSIAVGIYTALPARD